MCFANVLKKRGADFWLVLQGSPLPNGGSTYGEIAYQGSGSLEIARLILTCRQTYAARPSTTVGGDYGEVLAAFGYRSYTSLRRYTHDMAIWADNFGGFYGNIGLGTNLRSPHQLHAVLAASSAHLDIPGWAEETWEIVKTSFANAERFED